jgi:hypothetical protein
MLTWSTQWYTNDLTHTVTASKQIYSAVIEVNNVQLFLTYFASSSAIGQYAPHVHHKPWILSKEPNTTDKACMHEQCIQITAVHVPRTALQPCNICCVEPFCYVIVLTSYQGVITTASYDLVPSQHLCLSSVV